MPYEFPFHVSQDGYLAKPYGKPVIFTQLEGGLPRTERDALQLAFEFEVVLELDGKKYEQLKELYDTYLRHPDYIQLELISTGALKPHNCWIKPNSWKLQEIRGYNYYKVSLQLIGMPV